jgi:hypothetical protein
MTLKGLGEIPALFILFFNYKKVYYCYEYKINERILIMTISTENHQGVVISKRKLKESRYFWPDGTKKYYCTKCSGGPYHKEDEEIKKLGEHLIICSNCKDFYKVVDNKKVHKEYVEKDREVIPLAIYKGSIV